MPVSFEEWLPWYERIVSEMGYDKKMDLLSAKILSALLRGKAIHPRKIRDVIVGSDVLILGAGPSLEEDLKEITRLGLQDKCVIIAADGATTGAVKVGGFVPDVIVTDLDGNVEDILRSHDEGATIVIHSHGDNLHKIKICLPRFTRALGTTQTEPQPRVYNFGGFTDGDRCAFLAEHMGAKTIILAGMDIGTVVGRYSKTFVESYDTKVKKLSFCKALLEWLAVRTTARLFNMTSEGEEIRGFERTEARRVTNLI